MCQSCNYDYWQTEVEEMLEDERYVYSEKFLQSVSDWITENKHITLNQITAINQIKNGSH